MTPTIQALSNTMERATSAPGRKLLRGAAEITEFILRRKPDRPDVRWLYGQLPNFAGVIWRLNEDGALLSWTDELTEYLEMKTAEAKATALAAAEAKAKEKEELTKAARKDAQPAPRLKINKPAPARARTSGRETATPRLQREIAAHKPSKPKKETEIA